MKRFVSVLVICLSIAAVALFTAYSFEPSIAMDPLVRMPGTQPDNLVGPEAPGRCLNCHAGYNKAVEPGFNWMGSMMSQAARDFLFWSCLTVAAQDSIWALGTPNAVDLCERCHFPTGWLEGRSDPPDVSAMTGSDYDAVQCDFCHRMYDPFFEDTYNGIREGVGITDYWDETNTSSAPSTASSSETYTEDATEAQAIQTFNDQPFFSANHPPSGYTEAGSGQFFVAFNSAKRAPFADAAARHKMLYSRFHKSRYMCGTCHDVSNPVLANLGADPTQTLPTEANSAFSYFHVERTFSEFMLSDYARDEGAEGIGPFAPGVFNTSNQGNVINKCQDCHMRDVVGVGCDKNGVPIRPNESIEHPRSGQPLHDLTGGNAWVSWVLASSIAGSPNYDATNDQLLNQGPAVLTLDLTQGESFNAVAILAGVDRAKQQLELAASIENLSYDSTSGVLSFRIQNQTGHRLISGFPEGRRMFVNIQVYSGENLVYEVNPYDEAVGTLKGLPHPSSPALGPNEVFVDELVYETHPRSSLTGEDETFHFVLADSRYKDNRIPPKGYRIDEAAARLSTPVWHGVEDPGYFTAEEYAGGYDDVELTVTSGGTGVEVHLYYQTTSREYIEFLRDEMNATPTDGTPKTLPPEAYIIPTDPFFDSLRAWGDTIWELWLHNKDIDGAAPYKMAEASVGGSVNPCAELVPTLLSAVPAHSQVTLSWDDQHTGTEVTNYRIFHDQAGKKTSLELVGLTTTYTETGLSNGQEYCYAITSVTDECESPYSNVLCAIPNNPGQLDVGADQMVTGQWVKSGKGKHATIEFVQGSEFKAGSTVTIRAHVIDLATGLPLANAVAAIEITGPEILSLTSKPSDGSGFAEAAWKTLGPSPRRPPTTAGNYTATLTDLALDGYNWDGVQVQVSFMLVD